MPVTIEDVRAVLDSEEPDYEAAALALGEEAIPVLLDLASAEDPLLASKAVYLAGVINVAESKTVLTEGAASDSPVVRVAAAAAAGNLDTEAASEVLTRLLSDDDLGVIKVALNSVPADASAQLVARVEEISHAEEYAALSEVSSEVLGRLA